MAEDDTERSEDPTQRRLEEALQRGDVVKSQEVSTWFVIAGAALVLMSFSGPMGKGITGTLTGFIGNAGRIPVDGYGLIQLSGKIGVEIIAAVALPLLLLMLAAIVGNMVQHRLVWSAESMKPKFSKISPIAGLGRLLSKTAVINFVKGLAKLGVIGTVMTMLLWPERD